MQPQPGTPPRRRATPAEIRALASGVRLRILRLALHHPMTNRELAERLELNPATVLYHVRRLVEVGLLEKQPALPRPGGGVEIPYVSHGGSWALDIDERDHPNTAAFEAFLDEVRQVGVDKLHDAIRFQARLTPERRSELVTKLLALLDEFHADQSGDLWAVFFAMHPGGAD